MSLGVANNKGTDQAGLNLTLSETLKTGFLATRPIYIMNSELKN